jgi:hypothetical protein
MQAHQADPRLGVWKLNLEMVRAFSGKFDGKDYKVTGSPLLDTVAVRRIDALTSEATGKKEGKVILTTKGVISEEGKTETTVWTGTDEKGQPQSWTTVMDKQ